MGGGLLEQGPGRGGGNYYLSPCQVLSDSAAMDPSPFPSPHFHRFLNGSGSMKALCALGLEYK